MFKYFILFFSLIVLTSCTWSNAERTNQPNTTNNLQTTQAQYVDVREPSEWAAGHIEWAVLVPLGQIQAGDFSQIPKDTPVKLYCHSGRRAEIAQGILTKAGYTNVTNVWGIDTVPNVKIVR